MLSESDYFSIHRHLSVLSSVIFSDLFDILLICELYNAKQCWVSNLFAYYLFLAGLSKGK